MSLRRTALIGVAAGSAAAAGLVALALTASTSQASTDGTPASASAPAASTFGKGLVLKAQTVHESEVDNGPDGPSVGDRFVFADKLTMWGGHGKSGDKKVGTTGVDCVITDLVKDDGEVTDSTMQCLGTLSLKGGQVTVQGLIKWSEKVSRVAITGGTGVFAGASGVMEVASTKDDEVSKLTLRLHRTGGHAWDAHPGDWDENGNWTVAAS
jgi:hypothetical protein